MSWGPKPTSWPGGESAKNLQGETQQVLIQTQESCCKEVLLPEKDVSILLPCPSLTAMRSHPPFS